MIRIKEKTTYWSDQGKKCIRILEERRQDKFMAGTSAVDLLSEREHIESHERILMSVTG